MAPLATEPHGILVPRYYYYTSNYDSYYKGRMIGIIFGVVIFVIIIVIGIVYKIRKSKNVRASALNGHFGALPFAMAPPPYTGPPGQEPKWNGTQWQGPKNMDGTPGPCWNGIQWCATSGPVWNGNRWVQGGPINGVNVPPSDTGQVWDGRAWVGGQESGVAMGRESGVVDWHKRDQEMGMNEMASPTAPAPVYAQNGEGQMRDSLRANGVNADGGMGHTTTQSKDFGALQSGVGGSPPAATAAPEVKEEKPQGFKKWFK